LNEVEDLRTDLRGWAHKVQEQREWKPLHYEFAFGLPLGPEHDPHSSPEQAVVLGGVRLRGSIDLVERHVTRGTLRVTDHKTGKPPQPPPVYTGGGKLLQPLLYALVAEKLLSQPVEAGRLFFCTQRGNYCEAEIEFTETARRHIQHLLETIDGFIGAGFLPAAPMEGTCELCDYRLVCGPYEERRARLKDRTKLETLQELRNVP
jgi:CRISPR/Cas system-associated exonuclease Cas4 (RecB family)